MTKGKVVFAGTFRVESISVPVQLIRSDRKTIGVKVDQKGVVTAQAPYLAKEADILAFESNLARGISEEEQEVFLRVAKKMQENLREGLAKQGISICKGGDCE